MGKTGQEDKQPTLFGKKDELLTAINIEINDLAERLEAVKKTIENSEKREEDLEGRIHNLRLLVKEIEKTSQEDKKGA